MYIGQGCLGGIAPLDHFSLGCTFELHGLTEEVGDLVLAQRAECDIHCQTAAAQLREHRAEGMTAVKLVAAVRADEQKRHIAELAREMRKELE